MSEKSNSIEVSDEIVIEALLKDAKKFKSKWELNTSEPSRAKPNTNFLKRTLHNVVKRNQQQTRKSVSSHTIKDPELKHKPDKKGCPSSLNQAPSPKHVSRKSRTFPKLKYQTTDKESNSKSPRQRHKH